MRKIALTLIVGLPLLMGQSCANSPIVNTNSTGILAGTYTGFLECGITATDATGSQSSSSEVSWSRKFGSDGMLLTTEGTTLQPGDGNSFDYGGMSGSDTVKSITDTGRGFLVTYQVYASIFDGTYIYYFSGVETAIYEPNADGTVALDWTMDLMSSDNSTHVIQECIGNLNPVN